MSYPGVDSETYTRLEKLAVAVAKHGDAFEAKVAEKQIGNADFAFLTAKQGIMVLTLYNACFFPWLGPIDITCSV